jgi:hypothetical protein
MAVEATAHATLPSADKAIPVKSSTGAGAVVCTQAGAKPEATATTIPKTNASSTNFVFIALRGLKVFSNADAKPIFEENPRKLALFHQPPAGCVKNSRIMREFHALGDQWLN